MAPVVFSSFGDFQIGINGLGTTRTLTIPGVSEGDLVVAFAYAYTTSTIPGEDYGSIVIRAEENTGGGAVGLAGTSGKECANGLGWDPFDPTEIFGYVGGYRVGAGDSSNFEIFWASPPTGASSYPAYVAVVHYQNGTANTGQVFSVSPQTFSAFNGTNVIDFDAGLSATSPQADGTWYGFLVQYGIGQTVVPDEFYDEWYRSSDPSPPNGSWVIVTTFGAAIAETDFPIIDAGTGTTSPGGTCSITDLSDPFVDNVQARMFMGAGVWVQIWFDPSLEPEEPPPSGTVQTPSLHIPFKEYAFKGTPVLIQQYTNNWLAVERWANNLRCEGSNTPSNEPWKATRLHIPHKETFSARHIHENYLAFERWARLICPYCHVPHKEWYATKQDPQQEIVNLLTIERWARAISRCCTEDTSGSS